MSTFKLTKAPATLKPGSSLLGTTTIPLGDRAVPTPVTEMKLVWEIRPNKANMHELEPLFRSAKEFADWLAGDEDRPGEDRKSRVKLGEFSLAIHYSGADVDGKEVCIGEWSSVTPKGRPELKFAKKGEATLILRLAVKLTNQQLADVLPLCGADARITLKPAQMDLSDKTRFAGGEEDKKPKKKKAAAEEDPMLGSTH